MVSCSPAGDHLRFVDPSIGSEGPGRTFPGPSMPFGMVKPGPDCTQRPNAGWAPMPEEVSGFSQTHVSGTGGGQKYGNILIQAFTGTESAAKRSAEKILPGYYSATYTNGIKTELTTAERASFYKIDWGGNQSRKLLVDAGWYLGKTPDPDAREAQQFVASGLEISGEHEISGFSTVRGGWNNGGPYTVFFCLQSDRPFHADSLDSERAVLSFESRKVQIKLGISFLSVEKARNNIPSCNFARQLKKLRGAWEEILGKVEIKAPKAIKRQFYTAIYHSCLMPVDRGGENPDWTGLPYYDDYYALWDIYRTSLPLISLLDPDREVELVNSLLEIYKHEGYMPDARSGNCNGRTQGGSNAEVVIADAFAKGLQGIDYALALEAMIKDAEVPPADDEKEGRGGLKEYNEKGYIPYGIPRAGTRTVEYSYNDWCIAAVAAGLGESGIAEKYLLRSGNWRNLWRGDYEYQGIRGFIMPKDSAGRWLDEVPWGKSAYFHPTIPYDPETRAAPWYLPWWDTFFYEASGTEYSLSVPHDVPGLIEECGGTQAFLDRLEFFFENGWYNVGNEPSFLTPCLYHWAGRPELSSARIRQIIRDNFSDTPDGLPGNDDSGAMSAWHLLGLYPLAGQDLYLVHEPLIREWSMKLPGGKTLNATTRGSGHFAGATLDGKAVEKAFLTHSMLVQGGKLEFLLEGGQIEALPPKKALPVQEVAPADSTLAFELNRQYRNWPYASSWNGDTLEVRCNGALYMVPRSEVESATGFCYLQPRPGAVYHNVKGTFCALSRKALRQLLEKGSFSYNGIPWERKDSADALLACSPEGAEMLIDADTGMVLQMSGSSLGIGWKLLGQ